MLLDVMLYPIADMDPLLNLYLKKTIYMAHLASCFKLFLFITVFLFLSPDRSPALAYERRTAVVEVVQRIAPAVVNISSEYQVRSRNTPFSGFGMDPFFDSFFRDFFDPGIERHTKRTSLGSGVIIDGKRGFILTNAHVITKSESISVVLEDERRYEAQLVGADPDSDLAVLKIETQEDLPAVEMGDSGDLMIGETVIAIGNPFGFSHTVTTGVISALNRSIRTEDAVFHDFIQTDASINPGNSGGPLLNINGELIGINTAIYAKAQGIGFAIPIKKAVRIVTDLIQYGEVIISWTGLLLQDLDGNLAKYLSVPDNRGVMITAVEPGSPAMKAGIRKEDILVAIHGEPIRSVEDYHQVMRSFPVGSLLKMQLLRKKQSLSIQLKTALFPEEKALDLAARLLGVSAEALTEKTVAQYRISAKNGVVISQLLPHSYLASIGVEPGDVIRQIDDIPVESMADFKKAVIKSRLKKSVVLLVQRGAQGYYITVKL
jgi:Do/DeqQ family serine protease